MAKYASHNLCHSYVPMAFVILGAIEIKLMVFMTELILRIRHRTWEVEDLAYLLQCFSVEIK